MLIALNEVPVYARHWCCPIHVAEKGHGSCRSNSGGFFKDFFHPQTMWASRTPPQSARKDDKKTNTKERQRKWCAPRMQYTFYIYFAYLRVENMRVVRLCRLEVYKWQKETLSTGYMCLSLVLSGRAVHRWHLPLAG